MKGFSPLPHIEYGFEVEAKGSHPSLYRQVHGSELIEIKGEVERQALAVNPPNADGAFTYASGLELYVFTADCLPVILFSHDPSGPISVIHCGWRGARDRIVERALARLGRSDYHAVLGPAILGCCFEVKEDLVQSFEQAGHQIERYLESWGGRMFFSLVEFVIQTQLKSIPPERLHTEELRCTFCSAPPLPSYRRNKDTNTDPRIRTWVKKKQG
jgi:YfiH family protein